MTPLIIIAIVFFFVWVFKSKGVQNLDRLAASGTRARGLILWSSPLTTGVTLNGRRFERRQMQIDVEIPGQQAYIASGTFLVPRGLVEAIPGESLDIAVDPKKPNDLCVLGPGGFSGPWIRVGPPAPF